MPSSMLHRCWTILCQRLTEPSLVFPYTTSLLLANRADRCSLVTHWIEWHCSGWDPKSRKTLVDRL